MCVEKQVAFVRTDPMSNNGRIFQESGTSGKEETTQDAWFLLLNIIG